ncbi:MAG: biopolymer transporter ExbD [Rhizobiales bacterium 65-9]|nr:biopolymer transporter ExbD [Hyphomicrobiales bacterium]OJY34076.1 MAG: biopolymer transporter ExbD [Rhizobiales bacterium 65-9]
MAMSVGAAGGGGRRRRRTKRFQPMSDINMTPFIDVMLVLLIIFMVAAPLLTVGVPLDLPQTRAAPLNIDRQPVTVSINERGEVFIGETRLTDETLVPQLQVAAKQGFEERIYVRAAKKVDYGRVAQIMATITQAGYKKVALVTEPDPKS